MKIRKINKLNTKGPVMDKYPWIGIHKDRGRVVLFTSSCNGTVLDAGSGDYKKGYCSNNFDQSWYISYNGTFEISNGDPQ